MILRLCLAAALAVVAVGCTPKPTVVSFTATPTTVAPGDPVTLRWQVTDAESIQITEGPPVSADATQVVVNPTETTTYTLVVRNDSGIAVSDPVTVTVTARFEVTGGTYVRGSSVGRTFAVAVRELSGQPPAGDTTITITPPGGGGARTFVCVGGRQVCLFEEQATSPVSGTHTATATVGGVAVSDTFSVDPANRLTAPSPVTAVLGGARSVSASWSPVAGAVSYRVTLTDGAGVALSQAQVVSGTNATMTTTADVPDGARVVVEASLVDFTGAAVNLPLPLPNISVGQGLVGAAPEGWTLYTPGNFSGNTLTATLPTLGTNERLAVIVLNVGAQDHTAGSAANNVQLSISGTTSFPLREEGTSSPKLEGPVLPREVASLRAHDVIHALNEAEVASRLSSGERRDQKAQPAPLPALPTNTSFCTRRAQTTTFTRRAATLRHESAHLAVYVDDADLADYTSREPGIWTSLEAEWEGSGGIYSSVTGAFGAESDVDANGKLTVFFSDELGAPSGGGVLLGYFNAADTLFTPDTSSSCNGNRSNGADMFFMNGLANLTAAGYSATEVISRIYPDTLAHEFQHLINANAHCLLDDCSALEEPWLNEGLSMVAEDIAGFGWNQDRGAGEMYLDRLTGPDLYSYNHRSVTVWEGDPIGNYQGVHSLVRYWADRYGEAVLRDLVTGNTRGSARTEAVLLVPFAQQLAEWTTTLMFSNESFSPSPLFNFTGANWTPFHLDVNYVNHVPLNAGSTINASVRQNGWNAFVTGNGTGGTATLTVSSALTPKPHVVVVRFAGDLQQCKGVVSTITGACP